MAGVKGWGGGEVSAYVQPGAGRCFPPLPPGLLPQGDALGALSSSGGPGLHLPEGLRHSTWRQFAAPGGTVSSSGRWDTVTGRKRWPDHPWGSERLTGRRPFILVLLLHC